MLSHLKSQMIMTMTLNMTLMSGNGQLLRCLIHIVVSCVVSSIGAAATAAIALPNPPNHLKIVLLMNVRYFLQDIEYVAKQPLVRSPTPLMRNLWDVARYRWQMADNFWHKSLIPKLILYVSGDVLLAHVLLWKWRFMEISFQYERFPIKCY